jgi:acyl carrier protein
MPSDAAANGSQAQLELELKQLIVDTLKLEDTAAEDIDSSEPLVGDGLGLDSIDILELAMAIHRHYGVKTGSDDSQNREAYASVASLAAFILKHAAGHTSGRGASE